MTRFGFIMDVAKCNGCYACFITCRDEYCGNAHPPYSAPQPFAGQFWMRVTERDRGTYPKVKTAYIAAPCMHCEDAPCLAAHPDAIYRRPDGVVIIDPIKAKRKREMVESCPYNAIYWNETEQLPQKCTMCAHLLDRGWKEPRCAEVCPTGALVFGDFDDPESAVSTLAKAHKTEPLQLGSTLGERVLYMNLPKRFVAGCVVLGDTDACAVGATVSLGGDGQACLAATNGFGDFEFEGLGEEREYILRIEYPGYETKTVKVFTTTDQYIGDIFLSKPTSAASF